MNEVKHGVMYSFWIKLTHWLFTAPHTKTATFKPLDSNPLRSGVQILAFQCKYFFKTLQLNT